MMNDVIVTTEDLRSTGHCASGSRDFFVAHGLDWRDFIMNGIPAETLEATGDDLAIGVAAAARKRVESESSDE